MRRTGMVRLLLVTVFGIGLLALGGYLGWSGGYTVGLADGGEGIHGHWPGGLFLGFGLFFNLIFILFLVFLVAKIFRFRSWRTAGGPRGYWSRHGGGHDFYGHGEHESSSRGHSRGDGDDEAQVV